MRRKLIYIVLLVGILFGCGKENSEAEKPLMDGSRKIEVVEHMNGGGYTFIKANENGNEIWIAVREMPVEVGDIFYFQDAMEMNNFESKSLNKTFASILFVNEISKSPNRSSTEKSSSKMMEMMTSSEGHTKPKVAVENDIKVEPLADGMTVEMVNTQKASLAGKTIKVRGVVTKYNGGIMNRNWIHIQDGTGSGATADLTITSDQPTKVGETIIIEGTVAVDKDFGAGYFYEVIVENAKITVEKKI